MYELIERYLGRIVAESTPEKPIWNIENIRFGKKPKWNYIDGCMVTALIEYGKITGDTKYCDFAEKFIDYYVQEDGSLLGCDLSGNALDDICEGRVLFDLIESTGKEKYKLAVAKLKAQLDSQPRTKDGNWWHKAIYPNNVWLDGVYMAQVFSALWQKECGNADYSDIAMQLTNIRKYMFDSEKQLYYHGMDVSKKAFWADKNTGCSKNFWLRAIGWFAVALADIADITAGSDTAVLASDLLSELAAGIVRYADPESGMYCQVVDRADKPGNYLETSGSAMISYAMLKGARLGILPEEYRKAGKRTFDGIVSKYLKETPEGISLGGICLVAGLGPENNRRRDGTFEYYISEPVVENDAKGTAPFLLAYTEVIRGK